MRSPRPSCYAPTGDGSLERQRKNARILYVLPALLVRETHGNYDVRMIYRDIDVPGFHERGFHIGDYMLLEKCVEVSLPLRAGPGTVPLVRRKVIDNGCFISASLEFHLRIALVEAVCPMTHDRHDIRFFRRCGRRRCQNGDGKCD